MSNTSTWKRRKINLEIFSVKSHEILFKTVQYKDIEIFILLMSYNYVYKVWWLNWLINPLQCFFGSEGHAALDRNPGPGYNTLLLRLIPGDLLSACPHRQFHTLPGLWDSQATLPNSNPNALRAMQGGSLYNFYDGLWYDDSKSNISIRKHLNTKLYSFWKFNQLQYYDQNSLDNFSYLKKKLNNRINAWIINIQVSQLHFYLIWNHLDAGREWHRHSHSHPNKAPK